MFQQILYFMMYDTEKQGRRGIIVSRNIAETTEKQKVESGRIGKRVVYLSLIYIPVWNWAHHAK